MELFHSFKVRCACMCFWIRHVSGIDALKAGLPRLWKTSSRKKSGNVCKLRRMMVCVVGGIENPKIARDMDYVVLESRHYET